MAAIASTFALAGFVKGVIGLGLPTVAMGLLAVVMTPAQAAALLVVPSFITNVWQAMGPEFLPLVRRLGPMLLGICAGTWAGAGLLSADGGAPASVGLGGLARPLRHSWTDRGAVLGAGLAGAMALAVDRGGDRDRRRGDRRIHDPVRSLPAGDRTRERRAGAGAGAVLHGVDPGTGGRSRARRRAADVGRKRLGARARTDADRHELGQRLRARGCVPKRFESASSLAPCCWARTWSCVRWSDIAVGLAMPRQRAMRMLRIKTIGACPPRRVPRLRRRGDRCLAVG